MQATWSVNEDEGVVGQIVRRNRLKHNIGNLTLLTQHLNSKQSHADWSQKRAILENPEFGSLLVMNKELTATETWDETEIQARGAALFKLAVILWPLSSSPDGGK